MNIDEKFMTMAIEEAKKAAPLGEVPIGAVIVIDDKVIATGHNLRETLHDATAHAEIVAIQAACKKLKRWRLEDATMYVTMEPCPMCAGAIFMSRMKRLVYGVPDSKAGAVESLFNIVNNNKLNHQTEVRGCCLEEECKKLVQDFFKVKR